MQFTFGNLRNSAIEIIERNDNLIYIIRRCVSYKKNWQIK